MTTQFADDKNPLEVALAKKREDTAWTNYLAAVTDLDAEKILNEDLPLHDHDVIWTAAQSERERRMRTLAAESSRAYYPLSANHARIDTLLDEWEDNR